MTDELISQEEIEALLKGIGGGTTKEKESEELREIASLYARAFSNILQLLSGEEVKAEIRESGFYRQDIFASRFNVQSVILYLVEYDAIEDWQHAFVMEERMALLLADIMMGGDGTELPDTMNDLYLSAAQEGISQISGAAISEMVNLLGGRRIGIKSTSCSVKKGEWMPFETLPSDTEIWAFCMDADIKDIGNLKMLSLMPQRAALLLAEEVGKIMSPQIKSYEEAVQKAALAKAHGPFEGATTERAVSEPRELKQEPDSVEVRPAEFVPLNAELAEQDVDVQNINLIIDVPVRVTVRLGQAFKTIGEVLNLAPGSVIELDKMAGDPVDILVNGKLIARGEVVVIDENFGIRITEITNRSERVKSLR